VTREIQSRGMILLDPHGTRPRSQEAGRGEDCRPIPMAANLCNRRIFNLGKVRCSGTKHVCSFRYCVSAINDSLVENFEVK